MSHLLLGTYSFEGLMSAYVSGVLTHTVSGIPQFSKGSTPLNAGSGADSFIIACVVLRLMRAWLFCLSGNTCLEAARRCCPHRYGVYLQGYRRRALNAIIAQ